LQCTIDDYIPDAIPACRHSGPEKGNASMFTSIVRFLHSWKRYGVAMDELSHLSDRELADIGITRADIPRIAWEQSRH
jgi:uncharacterized protein YjiS (DUF1127 family)